MPLLKTLVGISIFIWGSHALKGNSREGKLFNLLNIVSFQNGPCSGTGNKNGTCYTQAECENKGGVKSGICAAGYGVCCVFSATCGQMLKENCTYFESSDAKAGACRLKICKCDSNVCQLRLDFNTFVINGPSTKTEVTGEAIAGVISASAGQDINQASRCLTDSFSVTSPGSTAPPTICGTNTGEHMYVDASDDCNELAFQLGSSGSNRQWSIKITQFSCSYDNLAPKGCTQYYFGSDTGTVRTFNYGGEIHLADQRQQICIRQEQGNCRMCYTAASMDDFSVSGIGAANGITKTSMCCGYGSDGVGTMGFDCLIIPGAEKSVMPSEMLLGNQFCGRKFTSAHDGALGTKTVCTTQRPFSISFFSDSFEFAAEAMTAMTFTKGFKLLYSQSKC